MKITKLEYQKKDPNRVNVYVDDKFIAGIEANDVIRLGLYKGQEISTVELNKIIGESEIGKLFNFSLNFLSFRPRSEWEIRQHLKKKTKNSEMIDLIVSKLKKIGQVDDEAFARWYVEQRQTFRPKGRRAIEMELRRKGIENKTIKQLSSNSINESELAKKALVKYHGEKNPVKLQRFLASRGFDWETIKEVLDEFSPKEYNDDRN